MIILTTALHYDKQDVLAFHQSLLASGFVGSLVVLSNNCKAASFLSGEGAHIIRDKETGYPINTRRFLAYRDFLRGVTEPVLITDIRDVIFQQNPEKHMPSSGVNAFQEWEGMTIGKCPYNSKWMQQVFGTVKWADLPIICAGVTSGLLSDYCSEMWEMLSTLPPIIGLDQAVHNHLFYSCKVPAKVWANEEAPVYTVGYIPRETVSINGGVISNRANAIPCMVHQYDRHQNLKGGIPWR